MTELEKLRFAYLSGAADSGKTLEQTQACLRKQASFEDLFKGVTGLAGYAGPALLGTSILGGGLAGYAGRRAISPPLLTPEELKAQELAQTYRMFANRVKQRRKLTDLRMGNMDKLKEKEEDTGYLPLF